MPVSAGIPAMAGKAASSRPRRGQDQRVNEPAPAIVSWTDHALVKAQLLGFTRTDVEEIVLRDHAKRARNTGAADWLLRSGRLSIAYNNPSTDELTVLLVTLWRHG
jgi:hypothetical protein